MKWTSVKQQLFPLARAWGFHLIYIRAQKVARVCRARSYMCIAIKYIHLWFLWILPWTGLRWRFKVKHILVFILSAVCRPRGTDTGKHLDCLLFFYRSNVWGSTTSWTRLERFRSSVSLESIERNLYEFWKHWKRFGFFHKRTWSITSSIDSIG